VHATLTDSVVTATLRFFHVGLTSGTKGTPTPWVETFLPAWADAVAWAPVFHTSQRHREKFPDANWRSARETESVTRVAAFLKRSPETTTA
jgi:hypothetical protein